tara:strand:- start:2251 stop:2571 length:321 start_codon:yes stop_codon:yes gene_type:complete
MTNFNFRKLPFIGGTPRQISEVVNNLVEGKINATGSVTLTNSATSTTVSDQRASADSVIIFMPKSSASASELYGGTMYVSAQAKQSFTITHANNSNSRNFSYIIIG